MISFKNLFKFKRKTKENPDNNVITTDSDLEHDEEKPPLKAKKTGYKRVAILMIVLFIVSGITAYKYFQNMFKEPLRPKGDQIPTTLSTDQSRQIDSLAALSPQAAQVTEGQAPLQSDQQGKQTISNTTAPPSTTSIGPDNKIAVTAGPTTSTALQTGATTVMLQQRPMYIPSKDILTGTVDLQKQKDKIEELKLQVEAKKLEKDLATLISEMQLIPVQSEAQKTEVASRIAEKKIRTVEVPKQQVVLPPPVIVSIINDTATLQLSTGEQVRVKVGDMAGDYKVVSINNNGVVVTDKKGEKIMLSIQYPEKYPVSPSMFGSKGGVIVGQPIPQGNIPTANQYGYTPPAPPQFVPIPGRQILGGGDD